MAYSRQWLVDMLRQLGYTQEADDALREMPDEFDLGSFRNSATGTAFTATD